MYLRALLLTAAAAAPSFGGSEPPTNPPAVQSAQQIFDGASQAAAEGRCKEALSAFEALAARPGIAKNATVMATIRVRRAPCLVSLGQFDEVTSDMPSALPLLSAEDPANRVDVANAHMALGKIAYLSFDYDNATREFELARSVLHGAEQFDFLIWLTRSTMFDADRRAVGFAEEALKLADSMPDTKKGDLAGIHTLHARALLNHGEHAAAYDELKKALAAQGGLTLRVSIGDLVTRADLALAALLNGDEDRAHEYMAFTGAGRFEKGPFSSAVSMSPPPCGGSADLEPDDMAIVEFGIDDEGNVINVSPIYASRNGPVAAEFARAVSGWSWRPEDAKNISLFFRRVTRVELRCSTTTAHPNALDVLRSDLWAWLGEHHIERLSGNPHKSTTVALARAAVARQDSGSGLERVPALLALANSAIVAPVERQQWLKQTRDILSRAGAPIRALTYLDVLSSAPLARARVNYGQHRAYLRTLLSTPEIAADAHTANTVRLLIAEPHYGLRESGDAAQLLTTAATDPALAPQDPIRVGALLRLASLQLATGNIVAARESFDKTGLSAQQCSLVDATPVMRSFDGDFPMEAMRWGFDGWVVGEFDIQADGKTARQRAVIAYPPLIFPKAALDAMKHARYSQSYRPEGGLGCGGKQVKIIFAH